jgi:hypothetical protein
MTIQDPAGKSADLARGQAGLMRPLDTANATEPVWIAVCCLAIILAQVGGVGFASGLVLHHLAQTLPLWVGVVLGFRRSRATGWVGLPLFLFWLVLMALLWLDLLGIAHVLFGHFSPVEIAMTIVVGTATVIGIAMFWRFKSSLSVASAAGLFLVVAAIQWLCFRAGFWSPIALR